MSFLMMAAQGASLVTGVMGAFAEGEAAAANAEGRAAADDFNAKVADQLAASELENARADAIDFRRTQKARLATSRAKQAASGFALEGSPMLVDESIFQEIEFGVQRIANEGKVRATRLRNEGGLLRANAAGERRGASNIRSAARINAVGAGLRGATNIYTSLSGQGIKFG